LIVSKTVTVTSSLVLLPEGSVTVTVTVLSPVFEQSNAVLLSVVSETEQLSEAEVTTSAAVMVALPEASRYIVISCAVKSGLIVS